MISAFSLEQLNMNVHNGPIFHKIAGPKGNIIGIF